MSDNISTVQRFNHSTSSDVVISVENLWKQYRYGTISHRTLRKDLQSWWARGRGKEDPNLPLSTFQPSTSFKHKYPSTNQQFNPSTDADDRFWALKDISFEVKRGEVLGIIGKNGAGKSTLLKIMSRVTTPTKGQIKLNGRIASLLEVGTGFHPELTGRENIFLNGAILGMTKEEIRKKFDEIVAFAEIEKFIDTPVKRYSSGMYVRLAFAVAAHLEPETLLVDEVLAVGDVQFQKKCLGKMGDVAKDGRTVLFVSHNMTAVRGLCAKSLLLESGFMKIFDGTDKVIDSYLNASTPVLRQVWDNPETAPGNEKVRVKKIALIPQYKDGSNDITVETPLNIEFVFWNFSENALINLSMHLYRISGELIFAAVSPQVNLRAGQSAFSCYIPGDLLNDGSYKLSMMIVKDGTSVFVLDDGLFFDVTEGERKGTWFGRWPGAVRPKFEWGIASK